MNFEKLLINTNKLRDKIQKRYIENKDRAFPRDEDMITSLKALKELAEENLEFLSSNYDENRTNAKVLAEVMNLEANRRDGEVLTKDYFLSWNNLRKEEPDQPVSHNEGTPILGSMFTCLDTIMQLDNHQKAGCFGIEIVSYCEGMDLVGNIKDGVSKALDSVLEHLEDPAIKKITRFIKSTKDFKEPNALQAFLKRFISTEPRKN